MASNLPSSFSRGATASSVPAPHVPAQQAASLQSPRPEPQQAGSSAWGNLPMILAVVALALGLVSAYGAFFMDRPLSAAQKEQLAGIADDLRLLQNRQIQMSAPMQATVYINQSYPIKDMFPGTFDMPLSFNIPIDTQLIAVSTTGQPVAFRVQENVPIKVDIPIQSAAAFGNSTITIQKDMPVEAVWSSNINVRAAYGQELNGIIDSLDAMAGSGSG